MALTIIICLIIYMGMIFSTKYRTCIALLGSGTILVYGSISKAFPASEAFQKFPTEIVILIIVLSIFTKVFENHGLFIYIGDKFLQISKGKKILIVMLLPTAIYATSLFMNNLSVILLFTFICLQLTVKLDLPAAPILVAAVIASNIGGAALPWADTPAVILTLYTDFGLIDFLTKMFIPCAIYNGLLVLYTVWWFKRHEKNPKDKIKKEGKIKLLEGVPYLDNDFPKDHHKKLPKKHSKKTHPKKKHPKKPHPKDADNIGFNNIEPPKWGNSPLMDNGLKYITWGFVKGKSSSDIDSYRAMDMMDTKVNKKGIKLCMFIFTIFIAGICVSPFYDISIAYVSLFFGGLMLLLNKENPENIFNSVAILDSIVFIIALFLIAGALESSGILSKIVNYLLAFTGDNKFIIVLFIMLAAFVIATFLSAGPATATILPICLQLSDVVGDNLVFAALAFGILAGSSMLPWSATGGPIMLGEVNRFLGKYKGPHESVNNIKEVFVLRSYLKFSIPFSIVILTLSGLTLVLYLTVFMGEKMF